MSEGGTKQDSLSIWISRLLKQLELVGHRTRDKEGLWMQVFQGRGFVLVSLRVRLHIWGLRLYQKVESKMGIILKMKEYWEMLDFQPRQCLVALLKPQAFS